MIKVKDVVFEDFVNYRLPSMFVVFPSCTFKCEKENGAACCQNGAVASLPDVRIDPVELANRYAANPITKAVVFGGLEPFDSFNDMLMLIHAVRVVSDDPIVIYTGYTKKELEEKLLSVSAYPNVIVKFGRYVPGQEPHADPVLGVKLASDNQYAEVIS